MSPARETGDKMLQWYLLMSKPREEARAEAHLANQGFEVFFPLLRRHRIRRGRQQAVVEPLFSRYLFIRLDEELSHWRSIRSTRGVAGLVRFTEYPATVPENIIEHLRSRATGGNIIDQTIEDKQVFRPGDRVLITSGSFRGWEAIVKEQDSDVRVTLLLKMLGKLQRISMPIDEITAPYR